MTGSGDELKGDIGYGPAEKAADEVLDSLRYLEHNQFSAAKIAVERMKRRWSYVENECTDPEGHSWVTVENIVDDNGIEVWGEEKCEYCELKREYGVKP